MIKFKFFNVFLVTLISVQYSIYAQESFNTSGGVAKGVNGSVSYSVGQVFYLETSGNEFSLNEGVQIPYELLIVTPVATKNVQPFDLTVFPNPTSDYLIIATDYFAEENLSFSLFDLNGRKVMSEKILSNKTVIHLRSFLPGVYMLMVWDKLTNTEVQKFKIIKTR